MAYQIPITTQESHMSNEIVTKSMIVRAAAEAKGLPFIDIPLSKVPPGAFLGVPFDTRAKR